MKKLLIGIAASVCSLCSSAEEPQLVMGLHLATYHDVNKYENFNPGAYIRYDGWTMGMLYNSLRANSLYGGYAFEWKTPSWFLIDSVSLTVGAISGYRKTISNSGVSLLLAPNAEIKLTKDTALRVAVFPATDTYVQSTGIHFGIESRF